MTNEKRLSFAQDIAGFARGTIWTHSDIQPFSLCNEDGKLIIGSPDLGIPVPSFTVGEAGTAISLLESLAAAYRSGRRTGAIGPGYAAIDAKLNVVLRLLTQPTPLLTDWPGLPAESLPE